MEKDLPQIGQMELIVACLGREPVLMLTITINPMARKATSDNPGSGEDFVGSLGFLVGPADKIS